MKLRGKEKNKAINLVLISIIILILFACFVTLILDIAINKSIIPVIFFLLMVYSILMFIYYLFFSYRYNNVNLKTTQFKVSYILFFFINLVLFVLSFIVLWN